MKPTVELFSPTRVKPGGLGRRQKWWLVITVQSVFRARSKSIFSYRRLQALKELGKVVWFNTRLRLNFSDRGICQGLLSPTFIGEMLMSLKTLAMNSI